MGGMRGAAHKKVELVVRLPQLQGLIKRDPDAYKEEFSQQYRNYEAELQIFQLSPDKDGDRFGELVTFVSHTAPCYKAEFASFPAHLCALLEQHAAALAPPLRTKLVQALILSRNRGMLDPLVLLRLFFGLFRCQDKGLRQMLYEYIVADIRTVNRNCRDDKLNRALQSFMYTMVNDPSEIAAKKSLDVMVELYRRRIWTEARTVNAIAAALTSQHTRLCCTALHFFLNIETQMADDDEEEENNAAAAGGASTGRSSATGAAAAAAIQINTHQHSKKTRARERDVKKQVKARKAAIAARSGKSSEKAGKEGLFPAIMLLHDPQGTAEVVFKRLKRSTERFEVKLLMMNLVSRVVGAHRLLLLPLYAHLQRYLTSHQREVTRILALVVQACHEQVPPDELVPLIRTIAHNFITERCPGEVVAVGINAVREMICRVPAVLHEAEAQPLVVELAGMTKHRDKSVVVAARGLLNTVRDIYPAILRGKDRGKNHDMHAKPAQYGEARAADGVDGVELLQAYEEGRLRLPGDEGYLSVDDDDASSDAGSEIVEEEEEEEEEEEREVGSEGSDSDAVSDSGSVGESGEKEGEERQADGASVEVGGGRETSPSSSSDDDDSDGEPFDGESEEESVSEGDEGWNDVEHDSNKEDDSTEAMVTTAAATTAAAAASTGAATAAAAAASAAAATAAAAAPTGAAAASNEAAGLGVAEGQLVGGKEGGNGSGSSAVEDARGRAKSESAANENAENASESQGLKPVEGKPEGSGEADVAEAPEKIEAAMIGDEPPELLPLEDIPAAEAAASSALAREAAVLAVVTAEALVGANNKRKRPDMVRVLTAEDFALIKRLKAEVARQAMDPRSRKKRKLQQPHSGENAEASDSENEGENRNSAESFAVDPSALEGYKKRRRATVEERMESVLKGREQFEAKRHAGGLTNLEKQRKKNFLMVRKGQGMRAKVKASAKRVQSSKGRRYGGAGKREQLSRDKRKKRRT